MISYPHRIERDSLARVRLVSRLDLMQEMRVRFRVFDVVGEVFDFPLDSRSSELIVNPPETRQSQVENLY